MDEMREETEMAARCRRLKAGLPPVTSAGKESDEPTDTNRAGVCSPIEDVAEVLRVACRLCERSDAVRRQHRSVRAGREESDGP